MRAPWDGAQQVLHTFLSMHSETPHITGTWAMPGRRTSFCSCLVRFGTGHKFQANTTGAHLPSQGFVTWEQRQNCFLHACLKESALPSRSEERFHCSLEGTDQVGECISRYQQGEAAAQGRAKVCQLRYAAVSSHSREEKASIISYCPSLPGIQLCVYMCET